MIYKQKIVIILEQSPDENYFEFICPYCNIRLIIPGTKTHRCKKRDFMVKDVILEQISDEMLFKKAFYK